MDSRRVLWCLTPPCSAAFRSILLNGNELDPLKILHATFGHTKNTQGESLLIGGRVGHDRAIGRIGLVVWRPISTLAASETWPAWQKGSLLLSCLPGQ